MIRRHRVEKKKNGELVHHLLFLARASERRYRGGIADFACAAGFRNSRGDKTKFGRCTQAEFLLAPRAYLAIASTSAMFIREFRKRNALSHRFHRRFARPNDERATDSPGKFRTRLSIHGEY